mmetsp:Transcript_71329/g.126045  ORF Transcript_71329/g.126045 Transcript_71329/m.126045 type:complete len:405 (-) Transcript_71329:150-1364(-)|eukprot:CAMPEP_0197662100 /NCGR_PEP_ID=MMETSP1338-20131121/52111_1 /TAXON_ID=43686 ORGANISM="Pelagodinium beii, Strain RCC1491" /NCGR_SAMPLE_ID=MMETSP1338 /ASSEMBLY_ACC=CAM_ASM_000754 /LENGTH=404 /DNA_ID=CAMNT_0043239809 /DNA_START=11 /DNA_END=1225 /DNA_ORIENTATION=+
MTTVFVVLNYGLPVVTAVIWKGATLLKPDLLRNQVVKHVSICLVFPMAQQIACLMFGAFIISLLESPAEESARLEHAEYMRGLRERLSSADYTSLVQRLGDPGKEPWRNWDFPGSMYYCYTLITTIGYGTFAPKTPGGKIFSCIYALVGIPFSAYQLSLLGRSWTVFFNCFLKRTKIRVQEYMKGHAVLSADGTVSYENAEAALNGCGLHVGKAQLMQMVRDNEADGNPGLNKMEYSKLVAQVKDMMTEQVRFSISVALVMALLLGAAIILPLMNPSIPVEDGIYWSIMTWTTIGLGDVTLQLADDFSLHGSFNVLVISLLSACLSLVASCISNASELAFLLRSLLPMEQAADVFNRVTAREEPSDDQIKDTPGDEAEVTEKVKGLRESTDPESTASTEDHVSL